MRSTPGVGAQVCMMMARLMADQKGFARVGVLLGFVCRLLGVAVHKQQTMEAQSGSQTADFGR